MRTSLVPVLLGALLAPIGASSSSQSPVPRGGTGVSTQPAIALQDPAPAEKAQAEVVEDLVVALRRHYVHQERVEELVAGLRARLERGDYAQATGEALAEQLSKDLVALSGDLHFAVVFDPAWIEQLRAEGGEERSPLREDEIASLQRSNFGFKRLEILEGNVGYVRFDFFPNPDLSFAVAEAAMRFVENADALLFDMRYNRGGYNQFGQLLTSFLFDAEERRPFLEYAAMDEGEELRGSYHTLPSLPGPRRPDVPVYVLTSTTTFSAGEWFAYSLQKLGRAVTVGARTSGASHAVTRKPVDDAFLLQVPIGVVRAPSDQSDFEGVGVAPDHPIASFRARDEAHRLALEELARRSPDARAGYDWLLPVVRARLAPPNLDRTHLERLAGEYEGRTIEVLDGRLSYRWRERFRLTLLPLERNLFAVEGGNDFRFRFLEEDGQVTGLERQDADGKLTLYPRL